MGRQLIVVGLVLYGVLALVLLSLTAVTVGGASGSIETAADEGPMDAIGLSLDDRHLTVTIPDMGLSIGVDTESSTANASMDDALDADTERALNAGLCATGLDSDDSPTTVTTDNGSVDVSMSATHANSTSAHATSSASEIVASCRTT